ncbi:hypothetical protein [Metabacillus sp. 22489]|uniref:hypothetical protein n=1 Tax=Metabacillus sp. 22489 TaxID=3453928 RepID=UPI003F834354
MNSFLKGNQIDFNAVEKETSVGFVNYMKENLSYEFENQRTFIDFLIETSKLTKTIIVLSDIKIYQFTFYLDDGLYRVKSLGAWGAKLLIDRGTLTGYYIEDRRII